MTDWTATRSVESAATLVQFAAKRSVDVETCLRGTEIDPSVLDATGGEITAGQELLLVRNIVAAVGDEPGIGLEVGPQYRWSLHGVLGLALVTSATVRQAVDILVRNYELSFSFAHASFEVVGDEVRVHLDDSDTPVDVRRFQLERDCAGIVANWFELFDAPLPLKRFEVGGGLLSGIAPFLHALGVTACETDGPHTIVFDSALLDLPMPQANAPTARLLERKLGELMQQRVRRSGLASAVRDVLVRLGGAAVAQEDVAAELHMSVRTLRRRLTEDGVSYREIANETLGMVAEELLFTGIPVEQVAHRLGYSGAPSFSVAFKNWKGTSPGRYARAGIR